MDLFKKIQSFQNAQQKIILKNLKSSIKEMLLTLNKSSTYKLHLQQLDNSMIAMFGTTPIAIRPSVLRWHNKLAF